ncbi:hypothetical protein L7F22_037604 [Adiantum nelumboides]|nr:hypothetical protein [Adiantum nelumboides]
MVLLLRARWLQEAAGSTSTLLNTQKWLAAQYMCRNNAAQKKKRKDSSKLQSEKRPRIQSVQDIKPFATFNEMQTAPAHAGLTLPCDLRRRVEDDGSIVTSSRSNVVMLKTLSDRLSAQITKQQNEIFDFLRIQMDQIRLIIEERTQLHAKDFLATIGEGLPRTLRKQDVELEQMSRKNFELQQKVNHLSLETQAWQSKAWSYDAMVNALRANLQQVVMHQTQCEGKMEGYGD